MTDSTTASYVREEPDCGRCGDGGRWMAGFVAGEPLYVRCLDCNPDATSEAGPAVSPEEAF